LKFELDFTFNHLPVSPMISGALIPSKLLLVLDCFYAVGVK